MDKAMIQQMNEALRLSEERPPEEFYREMVDQGVISEDGRVLLKGPRRLDREEPEPIADSD